MSLPPLTYTVNKTPEQLLPYLEDAARRDGTYAELCGRCHVVFRRNGAGRFTLGTSVPFFQYGIRLRPDAGGNTTVALKPEMGTLYKAGTLLGCLVALAIVFLYLPLVVGRTMPLLDVLVIALFPAVYLGNALIYYKRNGADTDAFMKEYIQAIS